MTSNTISSDTIDEYARLRFEAAWREGQPQPIDGFLPPAGQSNYLATLEELVHIELEFAWKALTRSSPREAAPLPRPTTIEEYVQRYEALNQPGVVKRLIDQEYQVRQRFGDRPPFEEYRQRFPQLAGIVTPPDPSAKRTPVVQEPPQIPGYEILDVLGQGGMGVVYRARHLSLNRIVALKVINREHLSHPDVIRRFLREARVAARLQHPHIVLVYHADQAGDTHYLTMEYIDGIDLQRLVEKSGFVPVIQACDYIRQAALGLQHAFEQGLVHRDVKPANLILTFSASTNRPGYRTEGSNPLAPVFAVPGAIVKILDMGLAKLFQAAALSEAPSNLTQVGALIGSPDYIAPEQVENAHEADIRSDLYSLGCTFYYLLTGQPPFTGGTLIQKLDRHRWEAPVPVNRRRPEISADVAAIVAKLLAKRPADRYATPESLVTALEAFGGKAGGQPLQSAGADLKNGQRSSPPMMQVRGVEREASLVSRGFRSMLGHSGWVHAASFSPDGRRLVSGSRDSTVRLWDVASGKELHRLDGHQQAVQAVSFSPDGSQILSASRDHTLRVWDAANGRELLRLPTEAEIWCAVYSPDARHILTGSKDQTVRLWDLKAGRELRRFGGLMVQRHWDAVHGVAFSPDGRQALSASWDRTLRWWDVASGRELGCIIGHTGSVQAVAFSADGKCGLSAGDCTLRLWDLANRWELRRFEGHTKPVMSVALSGDGRRALSGGKDHTVRLWEVASGREVFCFDWHWDQVTHVAFSPNGRYAVSSCKDRMIRIVELPG